MESGIGTAEEDGKTDGRADGRAWWIGCLSQLSADLIVYRCRIAG